MKTLIRWIEDQLLAFLQRRCKHPGEMVAVDILEGCGDYEISYCRRCGAVRPYLKTDIRRGWREWRLPSPNLWRG